MTTNDSTGTHGESTGVGRRAKHGGAKDARAMKPLITARADQEKYNPTSTRSTRRRYDGQHQAPKCNPKANSGGSYPQFEANS